jgi:hypothetical protein
MFFIGLFSKRALKNRKERAALTAGKVPACRVRLEA